MKRPAWPVPFDDAVRSLPLFRSTRIQAITDLNMRCLCRAYYGSFWRAAWWMVRAAVNDIRLNIWARFFSPRPGGGGE